MTGIAHVFMGFTIFPAFSFDLIPEFISFSYIPSLLTLSFLDVLSVSLQHCQIFVVCFFNAFYVVVLRYLYPFTSY